MTVEVTTSAMLWLQPLDVPPPDDQFGFGLILVILLVVVAALIGLIFIARRRGQERK
jgi:Tfp pilus assembly protein PilX